MRDVIVKHSCGSMSTFVAPNREIQLAICTAYLARDPAARVTHDLVEGQGWEAELKSIDAAIVISGSPLPHGFQDIVRAARSSPVDLKDHAIVELVAVLSGLRSSDRDVAFQAANTIEALLRETAP